MASWGAILMLGAFLILVVNVQCNEDIVSVINRIDVLEEDITRVEERTRNKIDSAKISLRSELKQYLRQHVSETMEKIIQGESIEEMVRSQVLSEVRQLQRGNHQMKKQLHQVLTSYRDLQEEVTTYKEALKKVDMEASDMKTCSKYIVNSEILRRDLARCNGHIINYQQSALKKDEKFKEMENSLNVINQSCHQPSTTENITSASEATLTSSSVATTTAKPEEEKRRIIVAPYYQSSYKQFRQIDIQSNSISTYSLRLKYVISMVYVSRGSKLLVGLHSPRKIVSSNLNSNYVKSVRENVRTYGMAVDEERELIVMTTSQPGYTISRMTTEGKHFTSIVDLRRHDNNIPVSIAVNTQDEVIYACNTEKLFMVSYDGRHLQILATGVFMYGVTFDKTGTILYYNEGKKLMSYSQDVIRQVTTLSVTPWNIKYYNDTVYFTSFTLSSPAVGAVDVANDTVKYTLQENIMKFIRRYVICLVP